MNFTHSTMANGSTVAATSTPATSTTRKSRALPQWTRAEIASRIAKGQSLVLKNDAVLNVTSWAAYHPGGALALSHFVGRDASDEIAAYHSSATVERMRSFTVATVDPQDWSDAAGWKPLTPPIALGLVWNGKKWTKEGAVRLAQGVVVDEEEISVTPEMLEPPESDLDGRVERARSKAYHELKERVEDAGLFTPPGPLSGYGKDVVRYLLLGSGAAYLFFTSTGWAGQMTSAVLLGLMFQQLTFLVHDAGHCGVTGNWTFDRLLAMTVADWIGGLSAGWWCDNHDIHHLVTNHPEHDPDIQHIPFFAITSQFFSNLWSTYYKRVMVFDAPSRFLITVQHKLYYIVLSLARFNLYALSYIYLFTKAKHDKFWAFEIAGICFYWTYFGAMLRSITKMGGWKMALAYTLVSHICAAPVHVQIVLSHFACSTDDLGPQESFPSRQLRTTMDVVCGEDIEFIHGGLHLQVTHHLFPRMPRHNLRKASLLVKEYCKEQEIAYLEHGWIKGNRMVLDTLKDVANQLQILKQVADKEIDEKLQ